MAQHYLQAPTAKQNEPDIISEGLLQKFGQGLTFGWRDELSAKLSGLLTDTFDPNFKQAFGEEASAEDLALQMQRRQEKAYADANPIAAGLAEVAGAVTTGIATGGLAGRAGATGLSGALGVGITEGGVYGAGAANEGDRLYGAALGGLTGGVLSPVGYGLGKMTARVANKLKEVTAVSANRAKEVAKGNKLGYQYTPAQRTGDEALELVESGFKGNAVTTDVIMENAKANQVLSNKLTAKAIGEDAIDLGTDTIDNAFSRLSREFEDLGGLDNIAISKGNIRTAQGIKTSYQQQLGKPKSPAFLTDFVEQLQSAKKTGLPAKRYQALHSELGSMLKQFSKDPGKLKTIGQMRDLLNEAVENSLPPEALPRWQQAREQWGNLQTLMKPGVIKDGNVSEAVLANKLRQQSARTYLSGGRGELPDVARFGSISKKNLPSSGTAERNKAIKDTSRAIPQVLPRLKAKLYMKYPGLFKPGDLKNMGTPELTGLLSIAEGIKENLNE